MTQDEYSVVDDLIAALYALYDHHCAGMCGCVNHYSTIHDGVMRQVLLAIDAAELLKSKSDTTS